MRWNVGEAAGKRAGAFYGLAYPAYCRFHREDEPPLWSTDEANDACFIVRDSTGQAIGYFYFEEEPGRRSAAKLLSKGGGAADGSQLQRSPTPPK